MPFDPAHPPKFYFIQVQSGGTDLAAETSYLDFQTGFTATLDAANNRARIVVSYTTLGTVPVASGGLNITSYTAGDMIYATGATTLAKLAIGANGRFLQSNGTAPAWIAPGALTKVDDTNVTLTLGGTPASALLTAASITVGWSGTLSTTRGGIGQNWSASSGIPLLTTGTFSLLSTTGTGDVVRAAAPTLTGTTTVGATKTASGNTASIATATPTTIFAVSGAGWYQVFAYIADSGAANYTATADIVSEGTNHRRIDGTDGTLLTITLSGSNVQVTQTSGGAAVVTWIYLKVSQ